MSNEITTLGLSDLQEPQEQRPEDHLAGAIGLPPEQGASALRSARANEVPPVVARSGGLPEVRPLGLADLQAMPGVARAITSPEAAAAVKDDGEGLSRTQRAANSWKRGVLAASGTGTAINLGATVTEYAKYQEASRLADEGASEARIRAELGVMGWDFARLPAEVRQRRLLALKLQVEPQVAESSAMLAEVERRKALLPAGDQMREWQAQEGFTAALSLLLKNPSLALDIIPESAAQQAAAIPLGVIGPAGVGAGAMVTGYPQGLLQQLQQAGVDTTSGEAIRAALNDPAKRQQILQGAAGYGLGLGIVEAYTAGLSRFVRPFGAKASSIRTREPIVVESGADVALNTGTKLLAEGAGGATGEILASGGTASAQDVLGEFFGELAVGGPMDLVSMRVGAMQESRAKAEEAKAVADYIDRVAKVAAATKIAGRDPKTLGDIVENMAADAGAPTTLYVTSEDLADALHQAKVSLNDFAAMMPEHSTAIIEGFLEGTAVPLPVSSLMQVAAQNPALNEALTQKVRPTEDGMSAAEATEFLQSTYNTRIVEEADKILSGLSARSPMRASSEALRKKVESDLVAAGQSPEAAAKQSRLTAAFFTTAAADMQDVSPGITPEEVFRKWYPDGVAMVSGPGSQAAGQEMSQFDVESGGTTEYTDPTIVVDGVERPTMNSEGRPIARTKEGLENFWRWFGDSKVVDADGKPLVVYHGGNNFTAFDPDTAVEGGFFFTPEKAVANRFKREGGKLFEVYLSIKNPKEVPLKDFLYYDEENDWYEHDMEIKEAAIRLAKEEGYDGVVVRDVPDAGMVADQWIAFRPEQIKSVFNRGTFDPNERDILKQEILGEGEVKRVLKREPGAFLPEEQSAWDEFIATRPDGQELLRKLEEHKGTPWAKQAVEGVFVRQAMRMVMDGRVPAFQSSLDSKQIAKTRGILEKHGVDGMWRLLESEGGMVGGASKPVNNVNSSFINCDPSKNCAKYCYATQGNYQYANVIVKSELVTMAIETDPVRAAKRVASEYKATAEFMNNKALRLFDKGDGNDSWIPFIEELNRQGVRVQIFSKVPEFLRKVPEVNLRLLSIDESNLDMADSNPDLPVAFVYGGGDQQTEFLAKLVERGQIQVVLPIKLGRKVFDSAQVKKLKKDVPGVGPYICPIDAGIKEIGKNSDPDKWNCTKCDKNGGLGCFFGKVTKAVMQSAEVKPITPQDRAKRILELRKQINAITSTAGEGVADAGQVPAERTEGLLREVDALLGELLREYDGSATIGLAVQSGPGVGTQGGTTGTGLWAGGQPGGLEQGVAGSRRIDVRTVDDELNQAAYHGSPYRFSKFSLEHMGKGEGAQAYGWGLYFAGKREVAEFYRQQLTSGLDRAQYLVDGQRIDPSVLSEGVADGRAGELEAGHRERYLRLIASDGIKEARRNFKELDADPDFPPGRKRAFKWALDYAKGKKVEKDPAAGQLYRVEIPDDDQYLLWDKEITKQPEAVKKALKDSGLWKALKENQSDYGSPMNTRGKLRGENIYAYLAWKLGSEEAASKRLNELGIPGMKYPAGQIAGIDGKGYNYVIFDDNAVQIAETYYQRQEEVRGAYSMRTNLLRLTKANNASTFLHESGHQFLDLTVRMALMPNASPAIVKRADAMLKWLGIEAEPGKTRAEVYLDMDIETLRPYHEKFAESFEAYLFKGQAPSLDLAEAFRAFKTWLKSVYRNLQSFLRNYPDAKLDPEITALMDRMLATDAQIAEAKASRAVIPLFDAKPESMTVEQWQAYLDDMRTLNEEAAEHIDEKRLADMQYLRRSAGKVLKQMQKDAAEKRAAARMEATRQVLSQPVYRLRQLLEAKPEPLPRKVEAKGLDTGIDSLAVAIAKLGGLNRDEAVAEWGIDPADFQHLGPRNKPVLRTKGGMSPGHLTEVLAEYGYLPTDKDGKADMNLLADRLDAEARGDKQYSWQADWSRIFADDFAPIPDIEENPFAGARLDRYWLESKYAGDERMQVLLPLLWGMATKTTGTGVNPDDLAPLFGYGSGDEMVRALVESRPTQEAIDSLTDRLMIERHGDIESPEALARLVDEAIMSRHRSRVLATELSIINAKAGKPSAILKAAKEAAGNIIDSVKVGALRPDKYKMAAARAGRDAMNAMARGDTTVAATAKQAQVLNVELFNDATREKQAVADFLKETRKWFGDDEKIAKSRNMDMVILARSILGRYGMTSEGRAEDAVAARARLAQYNPQIAADLDDIQAGLPQGTDYTEMTVADVRAIRTVAEAVWNMARSDKTMTINGRKVQQEELAGEFIAALGSPVVADAAIGTKTTLEKLQDWTVGAWAHLRRVQAWADQFGDAVKDILTRPINDAIAAHRGYVVGKTRAYRDAIERIKDRLDSRPIVAPELGYDKNGKPVTFAGGKLELLHAMLHTGNISNRDKLLMGRGWTDSKATDDVISTAKWDKFMARMYDDRIITKAEWDFCQEVWDILESMKPDAQKAHHAMFGYHFDEVTAVAVDTPFGTYRGGYVPAIADRSDPKAARQAEADDLLHAGNSFMFPTTGKGFTKRRVENYYKPLELDLRTITTHIDKVSRFIHIEPIVRDTVSFLKRDDVSTAIETSFPGFLNYGLNPWLQRVATQTATQGANPKAAKVIQFLSQRTGLQYIALSVLNALQGATGLTFAAVRSDINKGAIARATANYYRQRPSALQKIKTLSPFMANRLDNQQQEMRGHVEKLLIGNMSGIDLRRAGHEISSAYNKMNRFITEHGYFLQNIVQQEVDAIVWLAAYDSAESRGSDNSVAEADEAVRLTQQTTAPEDVASYEAGGTLWTLLVKFSSYFNMMLNAMTTEQQKALGLDGTKDKAKRLAYIYSVFFVTNVVAQAMVKGAPDDEDDKDKDGMLDEWLWWLLSANTSVMSAMLPGVGQGMGYIAARADDNPVNDRLTVSPTLAYLEKTGGGLVAVATITFREEPATKREVGEMLTLLSFATGIPTGQLNKAVGYAMDVEAGRQSPEGAGDYLTGLLSGKQW